MSAGFTETTVDLLRHGEAAGGRRLRGARTDDPLTPRGRADLERVRDTAGPWDRIVTSPLARCAAFAHDAAGALGVPVREEPRFAEYDFGDWSGRPLDALWSEVGEQLGAFLADPRRVTPPGGESAEAFGARVAEAWADLLAREAGRRVLLVAHGGVLRQLVADAIGVPFTLHAALEWPHAARSRLRVFEDRGHGRSAALAFHARLPGHAD